MVVIIKEHTSLLLGAASGARYDRLFFPSSISLSSLSHIATIIEGHSRACRYEQPSLRAILASVPLSSDPCFRRYTQIGAICGYVGAIAFA